MTYDAFRHFADSWGLVVMTAVYARSSSAGPSCRATAAATATPRP